MKDHPIDKIQQKNKIYYPRTYRHLVANNHQSILFLLFIVVPSLILLMFFYDDLTRLMAKTAITVLGGALPFSLLTTSFHEFIPRLGDVAVVKLVTSSPSELLVFLSIVAMLVALVILSTGKRLGKPVSIYLTFMTLIHLISCLFFFFAADHFPYTAVDYSELYVKQQVGIWFSMLVLSGLITGFLGSKGIIRRIITFFGIMSYSIFFGIIRYAFFLFIISKFSILYMGLLFFALGPFFDFMYLILIYGIYADSMIKVYDSKSGRGEWSWS